MARESTRVEEVTATVQDVPVPSPSAQSTVPAVTDTPDDAPKPPTLADLRALAKKFAPSVTVKAVAATPDTKDEKGRKVPGSLAHVFAEFGNKRVSHAVHETCSPEDAEAAVLRSVIAHHGG